MEVVVLNEEDDDEMRKMAALAVLTALVPATATASQAGYYDPNRIRTQDVRPGGSRCEVDSIVRRIPTPTVWRRGTDAWKPHRIGQPMIGGRSMDDPFLKTPMPVSCALRKKGNGPVSIMMDLIRQASSFERSHDQLSNTTYSFLPNRIAVRSRDD